MLKSQARYWVLPFLLTKEEQEALMLFYGAKEAINIMKSIKGAVRSAKNEFMVDELIKNVNDKNKKEEA